MERIFVPTDFSDCAENAFELGLYLCKQHDARLILAHGYNPAAELINSDFVTPFQGVPGTMAPEQLNEYIKEHEEGINDQFKKLLGRAAEEGITTESVHLKSSSFEDLAREAEKKEADVVIMGSHGTSGMHESLIGSNTQKFVRHSRIPVLVIKEKKKNFKVYNVAFASTFSNEGERNVYERFMKLFDKQPLFTHFLFVNTPGQFYDTPTAKDRIQEFLEENAPAEYAFHVYNDYSVEEGILNFSRRHDIDLIVMATHGYKGLKRMFRNSYTESVINHAHMPVLSYNLEPSED